MADELAVWLNDVRVATIQRKGRNIRLAYTPEAMDRFEFGTPLLSLSLPLVADSYPQGVTRAFVDGLLPEGESRRSVVRDFGLVEDDSFGLIEALGRDCAGALVIQPTEERPPTTPTTLTAEPLSDDEIAELVKNLRSVPLGVSGRVRISLAGVQEKLLLTRMPDGRWGRPVDGTPSTHILKPEIAAYPNTVENEALCMRLASHVGLDVAPVESTEVAGRKLIVVRRYDRDVHDGGSVIRLHQEDFCQATGVPPAKKYEESGGPSLRRLADIIQAVASADSLEMLLRAVTLNAVVGNGDAHGKNFSLLHEANGRLRLAPLYDLMSTSYYGDQRLAMFIDGVQRIDRVTGERIVNEAATWGMSRRRATEIVGDVMGCIPEGITTAVEETDGVPQDLVQLVGRQLDHVRAQGSAVGSVDST